MQKLVSRVNAIFLTRLKQFYVFAFEINLRKFLIQTLKIVLELALNFPPASCEESSINGKQTLQSGREVFCDNGWTVMFAYIFTVFV